MTTDYSRSQLLRHGYTSESDRLVADMELSFVRPLVRAFLAGGCLICPSPPALWASLRVGFALVGLAASWSLVSGETLFALGWRAGGPGQALGLLQVAALVEPWWLSTRNGPGDFAIYAPGVPKELRVALVLGALRADPGNELYSSVLAVLAAPPKPEGAPAPSVSSP